MDLVTKNYIRIALAGVFWGTLGFFGKILENYGLSSEMIAFSRLFSGFAILFIGFLVFKPSVLKIDKKGIIGCLILGVVSQGFFNLTYFASIRLVGTFTAAVLVYFAPVFMFAIGVLFYKEHFSKKKLVAVGICLIGCIYGATGGDFSVLSTNAAGLILGLISALTYALMPVLSKNVVTKYNPFTIIIYSFMFGALFLFPFAKPVSSILAVGDYSVIGVIFMFGLIASSIPYCLYVPSLHNVQISMVGVIASIELVVSVIISILVLGEAFVIGKVFGAFLIILSIVIMNFKWASYGNKKRFD